MNIELITWRDAGGSDKDDTWAEEHEIEEYNPIITSVGWVVKETENNVTLAMDFFAEDNQTNTRSRIPKGMIISRQVLCEAAK